MNNKDPSNIIFRRKNGRSTPIFSQNSLRQRYGRPKSALHVPIQLSSPLSPIKNCQAMKDFTWGGKNLRTPNVISACIDFTPAPTTASREDMEGLAVFDIQSGKEGTLNRLAGYEIFLSNTTTWELDDRCYKDTTPNLGAMSASSVVTCPGVAKYLTIYNDRRETTEAWYSSDAVLELCEVYVYAGCSMGYTGTKCGCPLNCRDDNCPITYGHCYECDVKLYGKFCNQSCRGDCKNNICEMDSGLCRECKLGYYGIECNLSCPSNCQGKLCDRKSGECAVCIAGYHSSWCNEDCGHCQGDKCGKDKGHCMSGCEDGWTGDSCEIKVVTVMNEDAAVGIGVGLGVIILVLVIVIVALVRHLSYIQRDTKSPVYMTDVSSSSNEQTLSRNQDHSYINVPNRVQHFSDISTTERNYEQLGPREVYIPNIYETTNVD
ncbi:multiple epidermal growth factor-like domains protein 10 [Pecten maximus]|uniref:multiple epidermal growth factor-like domains protein 10 n=1 Tax=Pecten maximus TaxID=6579 RepID=UPI0014585BD9|nr:multiple epidermal growth factor-like domains protein 10 [Pecten maximus]